MSSRLPSTGSSSSSSSLPFKVIYPEDTEAADQGPFVVECDSSYLDVIQYSQKLLEKYNHVVDVNSLDLLGLTGWIVYGNKEHKDPVKGRPIAVIGEYKTGKTFLTIKLMNIQDACDLSHPVWKTPGIGVVYPKYDKNVSNNSKVPFFNDINMNLRFLAQWRFGSEDPPETIRQHSKESLNLDFIIIDTEGTNAPVPKYRLKDDYLKEQFLRKVELDLADDFIYVINKFTKNTINEINSLISDINASYRRKNGTDRITNDLPLIVVHNLMYVQNTATMKAEILEVQKCYHETDPHKAPQWIPRRTEFDDFYFFSTPLVDHYFLVRDSGESVKYNDACIKSLQTRLRYLGKPRDFDFIGEFTKSANQHLKDFIPDVEVKQVECHFRDSDYLFDAFLPFQGEKRAPAEEYKVDGYTPGLNIATISKNNENEFGVTIPGCNRQNFSFEALSSSSSSIIIKYRIMQDTYLTFEKKFDDKFKRFEPIDPTEYDDFTYTIKAT